MTVLYQPASFEQHLVDAGLLSRADLDRLARAREENGGRLYPALRRLSLVESRVLARAIAAILAARLRGNTSLTATSAVPLGATLAPAIWLVWLAHAAGLPI